MTSIRNLVKRGGSVSINLPRQLMTELGWKTGDAVVLENQQGSIVISRVKSIKTPTGKVIKL